MKTLPLNSIRFLAFVIGLLTCASEYNVDAAVTYWDPEGAVTGVYTAGSLAGSFESTKWSASSAGGSLVNFTEGNAACFAVGAGATNSGTASSTTAFTVTVNSLHTIGGIFDGALNPKSCIVTLTGTGSFNLASGADAFAPANSTDASVGEMVIEVPMSGPGTLTAEYNGQMFLHTANTYTGGTQLGFPGVQQFTGIINFNNANAFGTGGITNMYTGAGTANCALVLEGTSAMTIANAFAFAATNTTVNIVGPSAGLTMSGPWYLTGSCTNANLETGQAGNLLIVSGAITGTAQKFNKLNPGMLRLAGANTYNAITTISNGTVQIGNNAALPTQSGAGAIILESPGILDVAGLSPTVTNLNQTTTAGTITNSSGTGTLTLASGSATSFNGKITDTAANPLSITKSGGSTLTLTAVNTYHGKTILNGGTLSINTNGDSVLGTVPASPVADDITFNGGNLTIGANNTSGFTLNANRGITMTASGTMTVSQNMTYGGTITGTGALTKAGSSTLTLTGDNSGYAGNITVSAGTLAVGSGLTTGTLNSGNVTNNSAVTFNRSDNITVANAISGTGAVTKSTNNTLTLTGQNNYSGITQISDGRLLSGGANTLSSNSLYNLLTNTSILDLAGSDYAVGSIYGPGVLSNMNGTLTVQGNLITGGGIGTYSAFTGSILGTGNTLVKSGTAAMALRGASSFTGSTLNINGGTVSVGGGGAANGVSTATQVAVASGAALELDGGAATIGALSGAGFVNLGGGTLTVNQAGNTTFSGTIRDSDFAGWAPGSGGGLRGYYFTNTDMTSPGVIRDDSQIYSLDMSFIPWAAVTGKTNNVSVRWVGKLLTTGTAGSYMIGTRNDDGVRLWLNGQLLIDDWTGHGAATRSNTVSLAANSQYDIIMEYYNGSSSGACTLWWNPPNDVSNLLTSANLVLPGAGSVVKSGSGTLTLSGANTYAGTTVVNGGKLFVANSTGSATSTNTVTVNSGGTIAGNGTIAGLLTLNNGSTISPGASPGTITTSDEIWNGGGQYLVQMNQSASGQGADPGWDYIHVTGALTINSTSASRFVIKLASLDLTDNPGACSDFNTAGYGNTWTILTADGGISGFDASKFTVDYSGFTPLAAGGGFGVVTNGNSIQLVYNVAPTVTGNPTPVVANKGGTATFSITAGGTPPLFYQWYKSGVGVPNGLQVDGATVSGATTTALTIANVSYLNEGSYSCVVSGTGSATSTAATLTVIDPPVITSPTSSSTVAKNAGDVWIFTATVTGRPATSYQWKKGSVNLANGFAANRSTISGATTASLTLTGVFTADNGNYTLSVTNADGNTTSVATTLAVSDPVITTQPVNSTFECGSTNCLSVSAIGSTNLSYQWYTPNPSGTRISGATNSSLCFTNVHSISAGSYSVVVSNVFGSSITSQVAVVTVHDTTPPVVTLNGAGDVTVECHGSYSDPGAAVADACDGNSTISVPTSGTANLNTVGDYTVTYTASDSATNAGNSVTRVIHVRDMTAPSVTLTNAPSITTECHSVYVEPGASASDTCAGSLNVSYSGNVDTNTVGYYTLTYTAVDPSNNSNSVTRVVHVVDTTPPDITLLPGANTVPQGSAYIDPGVSATDLCSATVTITTNGFVDTNTLGSYTLTYTATDPSTNSVTTNRVVQVTGVPVTITAIATTSLAVNIPDGTNVSFSVTATGTDPKTYTWYVKDVADTGPGVPILTNDTATATIVAEAVNRTAGTGVTLKTNAYYVVVDNIANSPTNSSATNVSIVLDVKPPTVTVKTPTKNKAAGAAAFASIGVTGQAKDPNNGKAKGNVAHVYYQYISQNTPTLGLISGPYEASITNGTSGASSVTWGGNQPPLYPGTNNLAVWTTDLADNANSTTNVTQFFYEVPMAVTLNKLGDGSGVVQWKGKWTGTQKLQLGTNVSSPTINLNVGETFTMTYTPDKKADSSALPPTVVSVVTNTAGMGTGTNSTKKWVAQPFVMQSNITSLTVEYDRDRFVDMAGAYNGLFSVSNSPSASSCGSVSFTLSKTGKITGNVVLEGLKHNLAPIACSADGTFVTSASDLPSVVVAGTIRWDDSPNDTAKQITGYVTNGWAASMLTDQTRKDILTTAANATMAIADCSGIAEAGSAIGTIALDPTANGKAKVTLIVPDVNPKTGFKLSTTIGGSRSGNIPIYAYYKSKNKVAEGVITGFLNGTDANITTNGPFAWIKTSGGEYYGAGFTNGSANLQMSPYTGQLTPGNYNVVIGGGGQTPDLTYLVNEQGVVQSSLSNSTNIFSALGVGDGTLKVTYGTGKKKATWQANGVLLQNINEARGFLLNATTTGATASGKLTIDPAGP